MKALSWQEMRIVFMEQKKSKDFQTTPHYGIYKIWMSA